MKARVRSRSISWLSGSESWISNIILAINISIYNISNKLKVWPQIRIFGIRELRKEHGSIYSNHSMLSVTGPMDD